MGKLMAQASRGTRSTVSSAGQIMSIMERKFMRDQHHLKQIQTVVIGGGQAGLAAGYHLAKGGLPFLILDANPRIGDAWRKRWDSLRLFTPARYDALPGMRFPAPGDSFPTKDAMADYLESYAEHFRLPVQTGIKVDRLSHQSGRFVIEAGSLRFDAENVIVAMANYQAPRVPGFAGDLDPGIRQLDAHTYRNPTQLQKGGVLVVGVGNSGADIAIDVACAHPTWLSGKESGHIPYRIERFMGRFVLVRIIRFIGHHILSLGTPIGRKQRPKFLHRAAPLLRVKPQDLSAAGIQRVPRLVGLKGGLPLLEDGRILDVRNLIWCTGFDPGFSWIDLPIFDEGGDPLHVRGLVTGAPGLYFLGLQFLYAMTSATVHGVGRDAEYIVKVIAARTRATADNTPVLAQETSAA
jgi:putative flavoprotein involved in K+ transport